MVNIIGIEADRDGGGGVLQNFHRLIVLQTLFEDIKLKGESKSYS